MLRRRPKLERLDAKGDVAGLAAALAPSPGDIVTDYEGRTADVGWKRRQEAARRLGTHEGDGARDALARALEDPDGRVRLMAIDVLLGRDEGPSEAILAAAVSLPDADLRAHAEERLAEAVAGATDRLAMLERYAGLAPHLAATLTDDWIGDVCRGLDQTERAALARGAARVLSDDADSLRAWQVAQLDVHAAAQALAGTLADEQRRLQTLRVMSRLRSGIVLDEVIDLASHGRGEVRRAAVETLGEIRHPRGVEALLRASADDDYDVRDAAMTALDRFGTAGSVWGMATMARDVVADAGGWQRAALRHEPGPERRAAPQLDASEPPQPASPAPRRRRWKRG